MGIHYPEASRRSIWDSSDGDSLERVRAVAESLFNEMFRHGYSGRSPIQEEQKRRCKINGGEEKAFCVIIHLIGTYVLPCRLILERGNCPLTCPWINSNGIILMAELFSSSEKENSLLFRPNFPNSAKLRLKSCYLSVLAR